ncbi:hypothetical protein EYY99_15425 [Hafnia alvei]|uniref:hypothetical protein n=1 Tax=Hafnia alvei TaxID=569 RepID=UPI0010341A8D|nr:hypothetical protein [Hafnia alvei]TBL43842.1 hypothetical protein EYY99_15425 [Hafnia alvei]
MPFLSALILMTSLHSADVDISKLASQNIQSYSQLTSDLHDVREALILSVRESRREERDEERDEEHHEVAAPTTNAESGSNLRLG